MRVLVTGGTGFIGRRLIRMLFEEGYEVISLVRREENRSFCHQVVVEHFDDHSVRMALKNTSIDLVVNLAAAGVHPGVREPEMLTRLNSLFPADLVSIAYNCGACAFVQIGSSAEYTASVGSIPLDENAPLEAKKIYGASKAAGSLLAVSRGESLKMPVAVLRLFNVFGPGEASHRLLPSLITRLSNGEKVALSPGTQVRDFMHLDDVCHGIIATLEALVKKPNLSGIYNHATGMATSVADFSRMIARSLSVDYDLLGFGELPFRPDDLPYVVGDATAFVENFAYSPKFKLQEAIDNAVSELLEY